MQRIGRWRDHFESVLGGLLPVESCLPRDLHRAMRYATLDGGKRIRPVFVYATGEALNLDPKALDSLAASIEIIHAYSLIHDDLPAMDDDDMRRGRPTVHRAYDEATAILAGDALQALAFQILGEDSSLKPRQRLKIITDLALACGSRGMAGGQMLDLGAVGTSIDSEELEAMHRLKTGALIELCVTAPAEIAQAGSQTKQALRIYGACVGLAFQIHDDVLDVVGTSETLGKNPMSDHHLSKPTFPSTLGLEASRLRARELRDRAITALDDCPGDCTALAYLADYVISRDR